MNQIEIENEINEAAKLFLAAQKKLVALDKNEGVVVEFTDFDVERNDIEIQTTRRLMKHRDLELGKKWVKVQ